MCNHFCEDFGLRGSLLPSQKTMTTVDARCSQQLSIRKHQGKHIAALISHAPQAGHTSSKVSILFEDDLIEAADGGIAVRV